MALITPTAWKYLMKGFEFSRYIHFHPFIWNKDKKHPELITSGYRLVPWRFNSIATFAYYVFVVFRTIQTKLDPGAGTAEKIYMQFNIAYFMFPVIFQAEILGHREEFVSFQQKFLAWLRVIQDTHFAEERPLKWSKLSGTVMALVYYSFYLNEFLVICCSYFRPQSPELLSSLLPDPEGLTWYQRIPFALWHLYVMTGFVEAALMYAFFAFAFILPVMDLVEFLSETNKYGKIRGRPGYDEMEDSLKLYTQIQRLVAEYSEKFGRVLQGCKVLLVFLAIFCTYGGVRFNGLLAVCLGWIGISTTSFLVVLLGTLGEFHNKSRKLILQWKRQAADLKGQNSRRALWLRKHIRSLTTICVKFGSFYYIDKPIVLTCFKSIFDAVTNFLVLNK